MRVCMYGCMFVWVYGCMGVCVYGCMFVCVYGCIGVCVDVCMCESTCRCVYVACTRSCFLLVMGSRMPRVVRPSGSRGVCLKFWRWELRRCFPIRRCFLDFAVLYDSAPEYRSGSGLARSLRRKARLFEQLRFRAVHAQKVDTSSCLRELSEPPSFAESAMLRRRWGFGLVFVCFRNICVGTFRRRRPLANNKASVSLSVCRDGIAVLVGVCGGIHNVLVTSTRWAVGILVEIKSR